MPKLSRSEKECCRRRRKHRKKSGGVCGARKGGVGRLGWVNIMKGVSDAQALYKKGEGKNSEGSSIGMGVSGKRLWKIPVA